MNYDQYFAAGTLVFPVNPVPLNTPSFQPQGSNVNISTNVVDHLSDVSTSFKRDIAWLQTKDFIRTTWFAQNNVAFGRVYIIPEDVEGDLKAELFKRHNVLQEGAKKLRTVLGQLTRCPRAWEGYAAASDDQDENMFFSGWQDERTLPVVYRNLPSPPTLDKTFGPTHTPETPSLVSLALLEAQSDLTSTLYDYQQRSIARMLQIELAVEPNDRFLQAPREPSPLFLPIHPVNSPTTTFHIDPVRLVVRREIPMYSPTRGGILCEEMGTGKTVMCIALILATLDQLSTPESEDKRVRTQWSEDFEKRGQSRVPSLCDLACNQVRVNSELSGWYRFRREDWLKVKRESLYEKLNGKRFRPFDLTTPPPTNVDERTRSDLGAAQGNKRWLTNATLLMVPKMLLAQWKGELAKHVRARALKYLVVDDYEVSKAGERKDGKGGLPDASEIANTYDLVIVTHERLTADITRLKNKPLDGIQALTNIRWLRLIVDEGNVCANVSETMKFARNISAERRWIVSGTPTTHLINVGASDAAAEEEAEEEDALMTEENPDPNPDEEQTTTTTASKNTEYRTDLQRLSSMIAGFLGQNVSPMIGGFHEVQFTKPDEANLFKTHVVDPACSASATLRWGSGEILERMLSRFMIRHRVSDIEAEVGLPQLTSQTIELTMTRYQAMTYNVLQSIIAVNAIDSERKDEDYLFHPKNVKHLALTMRNISDACLWHSDREAFDLNLEDSIKTSGGSIGRAIERNMRKEDIDMVREAHKQQWAASMDKKWRAMMQQASLPMRLKGFPLQLQAAWNLLFVPPSKNPPPPTESPTQGPPMFYTFDVPKLRSAGDSCEHDAGAMEIKGNAVRRAVWKRRNAELKKILAKGRKKGDQAAEEEKDEEMDEPATLGIGDAAECDLSKVKLKGSASPKVNFIIQEILQCSSDRFIIFSESSTSLVYIKEGLDAYNIPALILPDRGGFDVLQQFETDGSQRALLLLLRHGARGLNLTSANRVIFIEPVWQPDVESQAIKRAHRIGQQRPVTVQTLVMKGTAEQEMLSRREKFGRIQKVMQNDEVMRNYIANPRFIDLEDAAPNDSNTALSVPLWTVKPVKAKGFNVMSTSPARKRVKGPVVLVDTPGPSLKKRRPEGSTEERPRKRVAFASDDDVFTSSGTVVVSSDEGTPMEGVVKTKTKARVRASPVPGTSVIRF